MFDYHMHSNVSFDSRADAREMLRAAEAAGLREICFTDHIDYEANVPVQKMVLDLAAYRAAYEGLTSDILKIRRGMEFGLKPYNREQLAEDAKKYPYDFVLGSVHFVDEMDIYFAPYWEGKTIFQGERRYFEETLACVQAHEDFDVLGHLTYLSKTKGHPDPRPIPYADHKEIVDEILKTLAQKGKGLEVNTSGVDSCGQFLPHREYLTRFKELGGKIVTVGSDAHAPNRVGQYASDACRLVQEIFGYVCTFENRKPVFHKL